MTSEKTEKTTNKRTEVLSVKTSATEKDMILRAAARYRMPYSEFIRMISIAACRNIGIEEADNVTSADVRRRRPRKAAAQHTPDADAQKPEPVAV